MIAELEWQTRRDRINKRIAALFPEGENISYAGKLVVKFPERQG